MVNILYNSVIFIQPLSTKNNEYWFIGKRKFFESITFLFNYCSCFTYLNLLSFYFQHSKRRGKKSHTWTKNISLFLAMYSAKDSFSTCRSVEKKSKENFCNIKLLNGIISKVHDIRSDQLFLTSGDCNCVFWVIFDSNSFVWILHLFFFIRVSWFYHRGCAKVNFGCVCGLLMDS